MGDNAYVGADPGHEYTASLRIFSTEKRLTELIAVLGEATQETDIGDPVSGRQAGGPKRSHALWSLSSSVERSRPLDEHIDELVTFAEDRPEIFERLRGDCEIDIFCGLFSAEDAQGGFTLEPSLSRRLGELQLPVVFDIY